MVLNQYVLPVPAINFLLIGMAFSTVFANMISEKQLAEIMKVMEDVYKRQAMTSSFPPSVT